MALIQARLGSKRFPRKVIAPINGESMMWWVYQGAAATKMVDYCVVVCPMGDAEELSGTLIDNVVEEYDVPDNDVAGRFVAALQYHQCDHFVRICADSPLIHPAVIDYLVSSFLVDPSPMAQIDGFPPGQQAQIFDAAEFIRRYPSMDAEQREHPGLRWHSRGPLIKGPRMTVDQPNDLLQIEAIMRRLGRPHWEVPVLDLIDCAIQVEASLRGEMAHA